MSINRDQENAEVRWAWAKMYVEPHIKEASNDPTAEELLPNHEFLIRSFVKKQLIVKCRKTAFSWGVALDALARAATEPRSTSFIISYDEEESKSKCRFIEWIYDVLPLRVKNEIGLSAGSEEKRTKGGATIKFTSKAPTGSGAAYYCDEFSVTPKNGTTPAEILTAAIGGTTHTGYIRVGGTQRGPETLFNKIITGDWAEELTQGTGLSAEDVKGAEWDVGKFPWWASPALVEFPEHFAGMPVDQRMAARVHYLQQIYPIVEAMDTRERVKRYGNKKLKEQYLSYCNTPTLGIDMFKREFEMKVLDESETYFPKDLIRSCIAPAIPKYWFASTVLEGKLLNTKQEEGEQNIDQVSSIITRVQSGIRTGAIQGELGAAFDVARDHDLAVITLGNTTPDNRTKLRLRAAIILEKVPFPAMRQVWYECLDRLPIAVGTVDTTKGSVGRGLGEEANMKYGHRSQMFEFTESNRITAIAAMKARMENDGLELPPEAEDGDIEEQFLAIKRLLTGRYGMTFIVKRGTTGHADTFFSVVMLGTLFDQPQPGSVQIAMGTMPQNTSAVRLAKLQAGGSMPGSHHLAHQGGARAAAAQLKARSFGRR